jgi:hypothetical protein
MHFGALLVAAAAGIALASDYDDLCTVRDRRRVDMATFTTPQNLDLVATWVNDQKDDGTWDDVNYASGCEARE